MKKFSWRAFISFGLSYAMIVLLVSGIILYVSPPGRYAHWVNWALWGFTKEEWQAIHTVFSLGFIVLSVFHLFSANWKVFLSYFRSKSTGTFRRKRELLLSSAFMLVFFFGTVFSLPPFQNVMALGEDLTNSWEKTEERAPVAHAELLTLAELSEQLKLDSVEVITQKLNNHKISFENVHSQSLQEIANANNTTPMDIYGVISKPAGNAMQGSGVGRKTLEEFASELGKSTDEILAVLKENNIEAEKGQTLRTIGENNNIPPRDVYNLISK
ncbi:DUF4405 domain-containing protein [Maribellus sp. CM-23]|uniref:DUF4405 domain-containing protein n=1 Tax=Maribellus sp. CM-23 TaxID=2781026 RepID=UPI001F35F367|nr:DUF4405 domain-containing protein [Maribellus sp. CM-23]MCE4563711.1 DUF4405 domain-containing protein [Maribellus sp. CM-23]